MIDFGSVDKEWSLNLYDIVLEHEVVDVWFIVLLIVG